MGRLPFGVSRQSLPEPGARRRSGDFRRWLASVTGGDRYAVTVWCDPERKEGWALYPRCTCPVGSDGCKHAVAVVAEYLKLLGEDAEIPAADPDDERWSIDRQR